MIQKKIIAAFISFALTCGAVRTSGYAFGQPLAAAEMQQAGAAEVTDNPCNKQNDAEVFYDGSRWIQPPEWNCPAVNPRNYQGGIMLFFDKIGLHPDKTPGKTQRVYFSVFGASEPVSLIKLHIFYDTRLTVKANAKGEAVTAGKAVQGFRTGSATVEEGQLAFYAYSDEDVLLPNSSLFTIDFIVPENAEPGEVYPIGISYVDDGIVADTFIGSARDDAGKLQMTYVFTNGIYNGYIKMMGEKKPPAYIMGDTDGNGAVELDDAQLALAAYTNQLAHKPSGLNDEQEKAADVTGDGEVTVDDAQAILQYYTETLAHKDPTWDKILHPDQT